MSLQYFIDGYNLIWAVDQFRGGKLQDQREKLLRFLEKARPAGSSVNQVIVVFDGQEDVDGPPWKGTVRVIFSKGEDADAVIKRNVDRMDNPRNALVVTNDRDIQKWVKASKAKVMSCEDFLKETERKNCPSAPRDSGKLDSSTADGINDEMKRIWKLE